MELLPQQPEGPPIDSYAFVKSKKKKTANFTKQPAVGGVGGYKQRGF